MHPADSAGNTAAAARNLGTLTSSITATNLTANTTTFSGWVGSTDLNDYYQFTLDGTNTLRVNLTGLAADANVVVYAANGTTVLGTGANTGTTSESFSVNSLTAGTYYARVYPGAATANTNYTLTLAVPTITELLNNQVEGVIAEGTNYGTLSATNLTDTYRFEVYSSAAVTMNSSSLSSYGFSIRNAYGNLLDASNVGALGAGIYFLEVSGSLQYQDMPNPNYDPNPTILNPCDHNPTIFIPNPWYDPNVYISTPIPGDYSITLSTTSPLLGDRVSRIIDEDYDLHRYGSAGNDTLVGGFDNDTLTGGAGADTFRFVTTVNGDIDTITDFQPGTDRIQVVSPNFANIPVGTLATNRLVAAGTTLTTGNAVFLYNGTTGGLSFDRDGNGSAAAVQIATLTGHPTLRATDFQVVAA